MKRIALTLLFCASAFGQIPKGGPVASSGGVGSIVAGCGLSASGTATVTVAESISITAHNGAYPVVTGDCGNAITSNTVATYTIPQAGTTGFAAGWHVYVQNVGALGNLTINTTTSVFYGNGGSGSSATLVPGSGVELVSDETNWLVIAYTQSPLVIGGSSGQILYNNSGVPSGFTPQVNSVNITTPSALNLLNSDATNGLTFTFANPSAGGVKLGFSGTLNNSGITNPATTVNTQTCTLGSTCTVTAVPSGACGGDTGGTYPNCTVTGGSHITNSSIPNSGLVSPSTTVNGVTCTLGSSCAPTAALGTTLVYTSNHTVVNTDCGNTLAYQGSATAATLAAAPTSATCPYVIFNGLAGTLTLNPNGVTLYDSLTVAGSTASRTLSSGQSAIIWTDGTAYRAWYTGSLTVTFATLGTPVNGAQVFCSNCQITSGVDDTCATGGTGASAYRINGAWKCLQ